MWVLPPPVPVIVSESVLEEFPAVTVIVEVPVGVAGFGASVADTPPCSPLTDRVTGALKPFTDVSVIVTLPDANLLSVSEFGEALSVKSGTSVLVGVLVTVGVDVMVGVCDGVDVAPGVAVALGAITPSTIILDEPFNANPVPDTN